MMASSKLNSECFIPIDGLNPFERDIYNMAHGRLMLLLLRVISMTADILAEIFTVLANNNHIIASTQMLRTWSGANISIVKITVLTLHPFMLLGFQCAPIKHHVKSWVRNWTRSRLTSCFKYMYWSIMNISIWIFSVYMMEQSISI